MVGQNIGKYNVLDRIGRGGMGTVYRAMDETLRREVAIKVLNAELNDPAVAKRFQAEAITVARLNHPGIATVYELFQHDGQWLMVMEFLRGETLEQLVVRKGPLPVEQATDLCLQALGALAHAHSLGVVHRDLKPANLMATDSGMVKVMDFGIARVAGTEHLTSAGFMMGTPAYMAPEQVLGDDIDARADIYAMGAVFFHLLTAELPFKGKSPFEMAQSRLQDQPRPVRSLRPDLPEWVAQVLELALARHPAQRFQSASQFHDALRRGLAGLPLDLPAAPVPPELMATAAPGAMPVVSRPADPRPPADQMETVLGRPPAQGAVAPAPSSTGSTPALSVPPLVTSSATPASTAETPRVAATGPQPAAATPSVPVPVAPTPPVPAPRLAADAPASSTSRKETTPKAASRVPLAAVAGVVIVAGIGAWLFMRGRPSAPVEQIATPATPAAPASVDPAPPPESASAPPGAPSTPPTTAETPAPASPGLAAGAPATAADTAGTASRSGAAPRGDARGSGPASAGPPAAPAARGRAAAPEPAIAAAPPVEFKDTRLLVITGKKAEERSIVLRFADGEVAAVAERGGAVLQSVSDKDISYAAYTRGKDPRWSVVLAGPPAETDFPGGLFRSSRHWLALQSRSSFLILRLNDTDWRRVLETVTARTGVTVEVITSNQ